MKIKVPLCSCRRCKDTPHDYRKIIRRAFHKKFRQKLKLHEDLDKQEVPKYKGIGYTS